MNLMSIVAVGAGVAVSAQCASAAFLGLEIREDKDLSFPGLPAGARVFNFYAKFDGPGGPQGTPGFVNRVLNVGQANSTAGFGPTGGATFFQTGAPTGGDTAPNSGLFGVDPSLRYDTYVSIGRKTSDAMSPGTGPYTSAVDAVFAFTPDFVRGGWFNSNPMNGQGEAVAVGPDFLTFLGQFTVLGFNGSGPAGTILTPTRTFSNVFNGTLTVFRQGDIGGGEPPAVGFTVLLIPAPAGAPLLGVGALVVLPRRRRAPG